MMKKLFALILLGCMLLLLCGCNNDTTNADTTGPDTTVPNTSVSEEATFAGTWNGTYTYNGNEITINLLLKEDYTYTKQYHVNGVLDKTEIGTYTIDNGDIQLAPADNNTKTRYKYENDALVNNNHPLYKVH